MNRFTVQPAHAFGVLEISDGHERETTKAPLAIVDAVIAEAGDDWRACDVAGFADRRARRNVTPPARTRDLKPVKQPDLFSAR